MTEMRALLRFPAQRKLVVANCPVPEPGSNGLLVKTGYSLVSPGTEFQQVSQTRASLLRKAWQRPDLVALVFSHLKSEGLNRTRQRVENRLAHPMPMGYCAMGPGYRHRGQYIALYAWPARRHCRNGKRQSR